MKLIHNSSAYVVYNYDRSKILAVQRPSDDENLPNVWGLPAGSLKEWESFEESVIRSGREKLGVELKIIKLINEGELEREKYILHMKEYEVEVIEGEPKVPQIVEGITQYQRWKWASGDILKESADKGSLCSQLYLGSVGVEW